jgi:PIN domain nuclease of toxin-antitoxin system
MRLLLDTHAFIWWHSEPTRLSPKAFRLCQDPANTVLLSVATIWEMQIKLQLGKLRLSLPLGELVESQQKANDLKILPVLLLHVLALGSLPSYHKDPFDRMLIAQTTVEDAHLVSHDPIFQKYQVRLFW